MNIATKIVSIIKIMYVLRVKTSLHNLFYFVPLKLLFQENKRGNTAINSHLSQPDFRTRNVNTTFGGEGYQKQG